MDQKLAVVTGGARGIGACCVQAFLGAGYAVAVCDLNAETGEAFVRELGRPEAELRFYSVNVAEPASVNAAFNKIVQDFGRLDVLVNNAGITQDTLLLRMKEEQWDRVLDVNLKGTFLCIQAAAPVMLRQRSGRIINLASVVGMMGNAGQANYCASKAGVIGLTKSAARELAPRSVTVNAVAPGYIETDMTRHLSEKVKEEFRKIIPLARAGQSEDVAQAVLFLASDHAAYITGQVLGVNGGMYM
jgi:3-oxoacyl-[acyl-carrier protein] reductase